MEWGQVLDRRQDYHMTVEGGGRECWLSATDGTFGGGMKGWRMIYRSPSKGREEQILIGVGRISSAALKIHTPQNKTQENKTPCFPFYTSLLSMQFLQNLEMPKSWKKTTMTRILTVYHQFPKYSTPSTRHNPPILPLWSSLGDRRALCLPATPTIML